MAKFYTLIAAAFMASAISVSAQDYTVSISPSPEDTYEALPREFVVTFDGPKSISENIFVSNPLLITAPDGKTKQRTPITNINGTSVTFTIPEAYDRNQSGTYTVELIQDGLFLTWADGARTKNAAQSWTYTVDNGQGGGGEDDNAVKHDIEITGFQPKLEQLDIANKTLETLQIIVNCGDVRPTEDAYVTVTGPGYACIAKLLYNMGQGGQNTWLKVSLTEPKYNGDYTLSIPAESMGNPAWFENPETGRTNDVIEIPFKVIGGADPSTMEVNTGLGVLYTPATNTKLDTIEEITMTFTEDVLFDEDVTVNAFRMTNFQAIGYSDYGTASFERLAPNKVKVIFENGITSKGDYKITIPEGTFYTADFKENPKVGKCNAAQSPNWMYLPKIETVEVESTVPEANAKISHFPVGYQVIVNTSNNELVASMNFTLTQYESDNDMVAPKTLLSESTDVKNDEGAICWTSKEEVIFSKKYYYDLEFTLLNAEEQTIAEGTISFDGDDYTGIEEVMEQNGANSIFSIQGIRIEKSVDQLPSGLYIINGKKIIKK